MSVTYRVAKQIQNSEVLETSEFVIGDIASLRRVIKDYCEWDEWANMTNYYLSADRREFSLIIRKETGISWRYGVGLMMSSSWIKL